MNNISQYFNGFLNNADLRAITTCCLLIACALAMASAVYKILELRGSLKNNPKHGIIVCVMMAVVDVLLLIASLTYVYARHPSYTEKRPSINVEKRSSINYHLDDNGFFGTGNGGIEEPTPITKSATYIDLETGELKSIDDDGPAGPWAGPNDQNDSEQSSEVRVQNMEPNDDPGTGFQEPTLDNTSDDIYAQGHGTKN